VNSTRSSQRSSLRGRFAAGRSAASCFGHYGDKYGRKKLLQFSLLLVGAATFLMGCLRRSVRWLLGARAARRVALHQGFAVGGEWAARLLVAEHSPNEERGFWASWPQAWGACGQHARHRGPAGADGDAVRRVFLSWGWRVAFWLSAVVVLVGYYIRTKVPTRRSSLRRNERRADQATSLSVVEVLKRYREASLPRWDCGSARTSCTTWWHVLHHLSEGAGGAQHQLDPVVLLVATRCTSRSSVGGRLATLWQAAGVLRGCRARRQLGILRLPDDEQRNYVVITASVTSG